MAESASAAPRRQQSAEEADRLARRFQHTDTWIFDLDNTLYAAENILWRKIDQRMTVFISAYFGIDGLSARAMQKYYYRKYGASLRGLVLEDGVRAEDFLSFVHDIDRSSLTPDPRLALGVRSLPGRKLVFTNGSRDHALRTMQRLRIDHAFEDIFDIIAANLTPKPYPEAYALFFKKHDVDPRTAAMFEDIARNLEPPHAQGVTTVLVTPEPSSQLQRESWEHSQGGEAYIDFRTHDLGGFLESIVKRL